MPESSGRANASRSSVCPAGLAEPSALSMRETESFAKLDPNGESARASSATVVKRIPRSRSRQRSRTRSIPAGASLRLSRTRGTDWCRMLAMTAATVSPWNGGSPVSSA